MNFHFYDRNFVWGDMIFLSWTTRFFFSLPAIKWMEIMLLFCSACYSLHCDVYGIVGLFYDLSYSRWHFHFYLIFLDDFNVTGVDFLGGILWVIETDVYA